MAIRIEVIMLVQHEPPPPPRPGIPHMSSIVANKGPDYQGTCMIGCVHWDRPVVLDIGIWNDEMAVEAGHQDRLTNLPFLDLTRRPQVLATDNALEVPFLGCRHPDGNNRNASLCVGIVSKIYNHNNFSKSRSSLGDAVY